MALDDGNAPASFDRLTEDQAAIRWPLLDEDVRLHELLGFRRGEVTLDEEERWAAPR